MHYKVGSRGSALALAQTKSVIDMLLEKYPFDTFEIVIIKNTGDKDTTRPLDKIGSKGLFVDEIEGQLLAKNIDMAVHSMKDMPEACAPGLVISQAVKREDPRDALILRQAASLDKLKEGAIIGTGSKRRAFQLKRLRPDIEIVGLRGNVDTRIGKLHEPMADGRYMDGIILAAAGLKRLGREDEISQYFSIDEMIPSPAQGILAIELREDNDKLLSKLNVIADPDTERQAQAERAFLKEVGADCHLPVGAYLDLQEGYFYSLFGDAEGLSLDIKKTKITRS